MYPSPKEEALSLIVTFSKIFSEDESLDAKRIAWGKGKKAAIECVCKIMGEVGTPNAAHYWEDVRTEIINDKT